VYLHYARIGAGIASTARAEESRRTPLSEPGPALAGHGLHQRVETYIVISNPKRISTNSGFVQAIFHSRG
jgi:hypothetical protein